MSYLKEKLAISLMKTKINYVDIDKNVWKKLNNEDIHHTKVCLFFENLYINEKCLKEYIDLNRVLTHNKVLENLRMINDNNSLEKYPYKINSEILGEIIDNCDTRALRDLYSSVIYRENYIHHVEALDISPINVWNEEKRIKWEKDNFPIITTETMHHEILLNKEKRSFNPHEYKKEWESYLVKDIYLNAI